MNRNTENQAQEGKDVALEIGELSEAGVELSAEELGAVSGAMPMGGSWASGNPRRTDEWTV